MQAGRAIGAGIAHVARAAHIPRSRHPYACEGDARLLRQPVDDGVQDRVDRAFARDAHRECLQSFKVHGVIVVWLSQSDQRAFATATLKARKRDARVVGLIPSSSAAPPRP